MGPVPHPSARAALAGAGRILFLCSGNIVRSAFAEVYARHLGCPLPVLSAGTRFDNRSGAYPPTAQALLARGVPRHEVERFHSTHVDDLRGQLAADTAVFGMTRDHLEALEGVLPPERLCLLAAVEGDPVEIEDPMFHGGFEATFGRLATCVEGLVSLLREGEAERGTPGAPGT